MTTQKIAFDRVKDMDDQTLQAYIEVIENDLQTKQTKAQRLSRDITRHEKIMTSARRELQERAETRPQASSYRGLAHS